MQPSQEQVKEATDYCFEMLEKMEKARLDGDYHQVRCEPLTKKIHFHVHTHTHKHTLIYDYRLKRLIVLIRFSSP